jgi:two-component system response regulator HydG
MKISVLVVDDEEVMRAYFAEALMALGYNAQAVESVEHATALLAGGKFDAVLTDVRLQGRSGLDLLEVVKRDYPGVEVVMATGYGTVAAAVEAMKKGAYDYLTKPVNLEELERVFRRLAEKLELAEENRRLRDQLKTHQGFASLIGTSPQMQKVYRLILKVASKRHPVLIMGESGTGKELVARAIHAYSPWNAQPFMPVDCGALTPTLIESELFGHVRGAFTGAVQSRQGMLAAAEGGTVFLDEIGELPIAVQAKLLRVLQEKEIKPVGANQRTRLEARILAATNQDLQAAIRDGRFRRELYFRLDVVTIKLPPLRERKSDIPLLVHYFLDRHGVGKGKTAAVSAEAMNRMISYDWPGNVRELENCVQRALALGSGTSIQARDLPTNLLQHEAAEEVSASPGGRVEPLMQQERRAIERALEKTGGDRVRAAKLLGIGKTTIYRKIKAYQLDETVRRLRTSGA